MLDAYTITYASHDRGNAKSCESVAQFPLYTNYAQVKKREWEKGEPPLLLL